MTELRTNLFWKLTEDAAAVYAIVEKRVYPVDLPPRCQIPAISYQLIDDPPESQAHGEASAFPKPRYQINCWAFTSDGAAELKEAVKAALDGKAGTWEGTDGRRRVYLSKYLGQRELKKPEASLYARQLDFQFLHD